MEGGESKRQRKLKNPRKVAAGKKAWARKSAEEKQIVLDRLRSGREAGPRYRRKIPIIAAETEIREDVYTKLRDKGFSKREAQKLISFVKQDIGLQKRKTKVYKRQQVDYLPPLYNPLPKFFADTFEFFKKRTKQHFAGLVKFTEPIAQALGIVPPNMPLFHLFVNELNNL